MKITGEAVELKPCPFCGGPADYVGKERAGYNVECKHCGAKSGWGDYGYQVERKWNRRALPQEAVRVEALRWQEKRTSPGAFYAISILGSYFAYSNGCWTTPWGHYAENGSIESAKAAAQADYEHRIMSAIELSASPRVVTDEVDGGWLIHKAGRGWYRPNAQGYTNDTAQAGRYSHEDALSYSHPNGWDGPRDGITIKHESELQSLRTAALSSAGEKEDDNEKLERYDREIQAIISSPHPASADKLEVKWTITERHGEREKVTRLVDKDAATRIITACQQEVERLRREIDHKQKAMSSQAEQWTRSMAEAERRGMEKAAEICNERGIQEQDGFGLGREAQNYYRARDAIRAKAQEAR